MSSDHDCETEGPETLESIGPAQSGPNKVRVHTGAGSHAGRVRTNNEDQFMVARLAKSMQICHSSLQHAGEMKFSDEDGYLLVVADGMGGAAAGERASAVAMETVEQFTLNSLKWFLHLGGSDESVLKAELRAGLESADRAVVHQAESDRHLTGMGTTLTMAYCVGIDLYIVHAGDSRAYRFRDGGLEQITSDHTLVQLLVTGGVLSPADAKTHKRRNVVTNVIGGPAPGVHAEIHKLRIVDGDVLLICTDGLTEPVPDEKIAGALASNKDPADAVAALIELALANGGPDNVTAVVARYEVG